MAVAASKDSMLADQDEARQVRLTGSVVPQADVSPGLADRLYRLFTSYYRNVERSVFDRDQQDKDWILLLTGPDGVVQGFTTLKVHDLHVLGRRLRAVFSGNTIIDRAYWGEQELVSTWCRFMAELKRQTPSMPLYWYLICSGYRTYLYLPLFFHEFYPRWDREMPAFEGALIDTLGGTHFAAEYREGVIRVARSRECLAPEFAVPPPHKMHNAHVRFFVERNPGFLRGDELVCVTEFSLQNTKRLAHAVAQQVLVEGA